MGHGWRWWSWIFIARPGASINISSGCTCDTGHADSDQGLQQSQDMDENTHWSHFWCRWGRWRSSFRNKARATMQRSKAPHIDNPLWKRRHQQTSVSESSSQNSKSRKAWFSTSGMIICGSLLECPDTILDDDLACAGMGCFGYLLRLSDAYLCHDFGCAIWKYKTDLWSCESSPTKTDCLRWWRLTVKDWRIIVC